MSPTPTQTTAATKETFSQAAVAVQQTSPWHSPVPYLFGGLAAMLGLIAFALLILACSYWKLSGHLENSQGGEGEDDERDLEAGGEKPVSAMPPPVWEEKIVVIMAGDVKPTFLATPMSSLASSKAAASGFSDVKSDEMKAEEERENSEVDTSEKPKE